MLSAAVQVALLMAGLADVWRRPKEDIRGAYRFWTAVSFVNCMGPISYFLFGRKR
jgi:hypothetical protein